MNRRTLLTGMLGALGVAVTSLPAFAANWEFLGSRRVNWVLDHDTIHVGLLEGGFENILVKVRGNGLFMHHLKVVYRNGSVQHVPLRFHFAQGTHSRVISLAGSNDRIIRNIQMTYSKPFNGNGATWVDVFGKH